MTIYAHPKRVRYYDYGSYTGKAEGLCWSPDGDPRNAFGFEHGEFETLFATKAAKLAEASNCGITLERGPRVERRVDMNPHGLI